jgi:endogenous inhibitor of DNA gyrase (YacG/DUF329 family)
MASKRTLNLRCPICKKPVKNKDAEFPFCSDRCRQIDLGKWASGTYVIASPVDDLSDSISGSASQPDNPDED